MDPWEFNLYSEAARDYPSKSERVVVILHGDRRRGSSWRADDCCPQQPGRRSTRAQKREAGMLPAWPVSRLPTRLCWVSTSPSLLGGSQKGVCSGDRVNLCCGKGDVCIGLEREVVWVGRKLIQAFAEPTSLDSGDTHRERLLVAQAG